MEQSNTCEIGNNLKLNSMLIFVLTREIYLKFIMGHCLTGILIYRNILFNEGAVNNHDIPHGHIMHNHNWQLGPSCPSPK
jgi:hypothetical protein